MDKFLLKASEDAHLDAFQTGFESANDGLMNASSYIVENLLTYLALKGALEDIQDQKKSRNELISFLS